MLRLFGRKICSRQIEAAMSISMYEVSVPIFIQFLSALSDVLSKAEAHIKASASTKASCMNMRLYPDMYPFVLQVQQCCTHAERICSVLSDRPALRLPNTEKSLGDLQTRIAKTIAFLKGFYA